MKKDDLRELYKRCDPHEMLEAGDPRYVDLDATDEERGPRGRRWAQRVMRELELSSSPKTWLVTGSPGCGLSTELVALDHSVKAGNFWPILLKMDVPSPFIDLSAPLSLSQLIAELVFGTASAFYSSKVEKLSTSPAGHFSSFLFEAKPVPTSLLSEGSSNISASVQRLLQALEQERFTYLNHAREDLAHCDELAREKAGPLVIILDGLNTLRGHNNNWRKVLDSAERVFRALPTLDLPVHLIVAAPPALLTRDVPGIEVLPLPRIAERRTHSPHEPGIAVLRELVRRRVSDEQLEQLLGPHFEQRTREAIEWSGGSPRQLVSILRAVTLAPSLPMSEASWRELESKHFEPYRELIFDNDLELLERIHATGERQLDTGRQLDTFARMLERNLVSIYSDAQLWFDVHPSVLRHPHFARGDEVDSGEPVEPVRASQPALRLERIVLTDIRCFDALELELTRDDATADWILVLGDNAHGKSTLLRAIALGLCAESEAAALLEAIPGPLIRYGEAEGNIRLTLVDREGKRYRSETRIVGDPDGEPGVEKLERTLWEPDPAQVFVCAYGANRTQTADLSHAGYSRHDAVVSLFSDEISLQNPELVLRRQPRAIRERIEAKLLEVLMLDPERAKISYSSTRGLQIRGPWMSGEWVSAELATLSDGYRSTTQWVVDLLGWLVYAGRFGREQDMTGLVLIDELEQHLHPRWQRYIIELLQRQFPGLQFLVSTHTPALALGLSDRERGLLVRLDKDPERQVGAQLVDPRELRGLRADQVLTSHKGFGLPTSRSPGSTRKIERYAELSQRAELSPAEQAELSELRAQLKQAYVLGETPYERRVEQAVRDTLARMATEPLTELDELELRRQLDELFAAGEESPA